MCRRACFALAAFLAASPSPLQAQTFFPGSGWVTSGYVSPLEPGNLLTTYAFEQGISLGKWGVHSLVPYAGITIAQDRDGLEWNNKAMSQAGVKYVRALRGGVVQAGGGYAHEHRLLSGRTLGQPIGFASYWFGWNRNIQRGSSRRLWSSLPGTSWATVGNLVPAEGNNITTSVFLQQGITLATVGRISFIPFLEHTVTFDTAGHSWNNRRTHGHGLKVRVGVGRGVLEAATAFKHERRWRGGLSGDGLTTTVNFWYGWNPSKQKER